MCDCQHQPSALLVDVCCNKKKSKCGGGKKHHKCHGSAKKCCCAPAAPACPPVCPPASLVRQSTAHVTFTPEEPGGLVSVTVSGAQGFTLHVTLSNSNSAIGLLFVTFANSSQLVFPIQPNTSFALTQAAGSTPGVDDVITFTTNLSMTGWISAETVQTGGTVSVVLA